MPKTVELEILITGNTVEVMVNDEKLLLGILGELYSQSFSKIGDVSKYKFTIDVAEGEKVDRN